MSRYTGPKNRIARKFGANIFTKARNPLAHKPHPPGQHGSRRKKPSDYGLQLQEKQKLCACYGMLTQHQLLKYYRQAIAQKGNTPQLFVEQLECRLDTLVYRAKFAATPFQAQQLVHHGHVLVDGKKVDIRSYQVKPEQTISIREKSKSIKFIKQNLERTSVETPEYMSLNAPDMSCQLLITPQLDQIPLPLVVNVAVVCEFLAHTS